MAGHEILRVDLTRGTAEREEVPPDLMRSFLGGKGLAAHYLATELPTGADPLGPENLLIFMTGPLSGLFPGTCRHAVVTKSPATGGFNDTYAGGYFAWELRKAGLLGIIITGRADSLVYLDIVDDAVQIVDASDFKGKSVSAVDDDPRFADRRVAAIGPAGENLVLFAGIGNNLGMTKNGRSGYNGRAGAGTVMGSKNLKAIAVKGTRRISLGDEAKALSKSLSERALASDSPASWLSSSGTSALVEWTNAVNLLPTRNFSSGSFEGAERIGELAVKANRVANVACYNCPLKCARKLKVTSGLGEYPGAEADKLEYESIALGAANTGNADFSAMVAFGDLCDELGLDTISTGACIAFAMDAAEKGFLDHPIRFGDSRGELALADDIAHRRGLGAVLADGVKRAAVALNVPQAEVAVAEIKGLEFPGYDPRGSVGMALAYATSDRGACHMRAWPIAYDALSEGDEPGNPYTAEGKARLVIDEQDGNCCEWSLVGCDFLVYGAAEAIPMLKTVGIELTEAEYKRIGTRIWNLIRLFNLGQGWTAADDYAPVFLQKPLLDSGRSLSPEVFKAMLTDYYSLRGWDEEGRPTAALVGQLDLAPYAAYGDV